MLQRFTEEEVRSFSQLFWEKLRAWLTQIRCFKPQIFIFFLSTSYDSSMNNGHFLHTALFMVICFLSGAHRPLWGEQMGFLKQIFILSASFMVSLNLHMCLFLSIGRVSQCNLWRTYCQQQLIVRILLPSEICT